MTKQYGFLVNTAACHGCGTCVMACKSENNLPTKVWWRKLDEKQSSDPAEWCWLSTACHHCDRPACLKVCPVKAYTKRADGVVVQDHAKCIGCQACVGACPYHAPVYDAKERKVSKCNFCAERLDRGQPPACVAACPAGALQFGEIAELRRKYGKDLRWAELYMGFPSAKTTGPNLVVLAAHKR